MPSAYGRKKFKVHSGEPTGADGSTSWRAASVGAPLQQRRRRIGLQDIEGGVLLPWVLRGHEEAVGQT